MSRFSKAEAERRGWVFAHSRGEHTIITSETQGNSRLVPATLRAEKYVQRPGVNAVLVNEEAETLGLLLERIYSYEQHLEGLDALPPSPVVIDESAIPLNEVGLPIRNVVTAEGTMTEEEWSSRSKNDAIFDGESMVFTGPTAAAISAQQASEDISREREDLRTAEADPGPTKQVIVDNSNDIDRPGQGAGSVLIVREDENSLVDLASRREAEATEAEESRVANLSGVPNERNPVSEEDALLAGVDVGIQSRAGLDSERPRAHDIEGIEPPPDVEIPAESVADVRSEAEEEKAKEIRDEEGAAASDEPENADEVREAGAEAEQEAHDESIQPEAQAPENVEEQVSDENE